MIWISAVSLFQVQDAMILFAALNLSEIEDCGEVRTDRAERMRSRMDSDVSLV